MSSVELPQGWEELDVAKLKYEKGKSSQRYKQGNHIYLSPEYLRNGTISMRVEEFPGCVFTNGDESILLWDGSNAGEVFKSKKGILASTMVKFVVKNDFDAEYFFYSLKFHEEQIKAECRGSGIPHVDKSTLGKLKYTRPKSIKEQQKIAHILFTIDNTIDKTKELVEKNKKIKQGVIKDLFEPKTDWKAHSLNELGTLKNGVNKAKIDFGFGTKFVNIIDAYPEKLSTVKLERINVNYMEKMVYRLDEGDIIFVRSSVKPEGVGYNTLFEGCEEDVVFCGFMIRYRLHNKTEYNPTFFNFYMRSQNFRRMLLAFSTVSANTNINQDNLKKLKVYTPTKDEQLRIVKILESIDFRIESEESYLSKLLKIKAGLMQDLLIGNKNKEIKAMVAT